MNLKDLKIEIVGPDLIESIKNVHDQAFGQPQEGILTESLMIGPTFVPGLSIGAFYYGELIGHNLITEVTLKSGNDQETSLSLAPIGVIPKFQSSGIGSMLMEEGIGRAKQLGYKNILLLGHPEYYPRFGFVKASKFGIACPWPAPDEAWMVLEIEENSLSAKNYTVEFPEPFFQTD